MIRRIIISIVICLLCVSPLYASTFRVVRSTTDDSVLFGVGTSATLYTDILNMNRAYADDSIGVFYRASRGSTIDIDLKAEGSFKPPATDGATDVAYLILEDLDLALDDTDWHMATIDTVIPPYIRFSVTGSGSNSDGTVFEIKVITSGL